MNSEEKQVIQDATQAFRLKDIILFESRFTRPSESPLSEPAEYEQTVKRIVTYQHHQAEGVGQILAVRVDLGVRLCAISEEPESAITNSEESADGNIQFQIEADFIALYDIQAHLEDSHLRIFSEQNGIHNVWPFWRQHVFDIVQRGQLPKIEVPLYAPVTTSATTQAE